jgi:hypothetical protein
MSDPQDYTVGSSSLVLGCDSYTQSAELGDREFVMGMNVVVRGGIVQTRPGTRSLFCLPDGNFQGITMFTPQNGVAHIVFAIEGAVYVSPAPFTEYRRLWTIQFSNTSKQMAWASCLKSTDYDPAGNLITLANPYSVLIMQDGVTRAAYWDGSVAAHMNPASPPWPDETDNIPGYNETPVGLWMIWSGNRLWVSRENKIFAGDIGNPMKFTETIYINEGRSFYLSGPCTGMVEVPTDTGQSKGFIAFTDSNGTLFQSYIQDRTAWLNTTLFQNTILPNIGCVAPRSLITQYGLNWWFGPRGFTNLNAAFRQNISSRVDYQDNEMFSSKAYIGPDLSGICSGYYENYLMVSVPSGDVLNRHTWVLDQAPFDGNTNSWCGFWSGWRPIEWARGLVNGSERVFFGSIDYDGKNRIWEAMLPERTDNGCRITCYAQLRDHAAGNLNQKKYDWSKFFLSQVYGAVDLNVYVASTKGGFQLQKNYHLEASRGQIFGDVQYGENGPYLIGNRVQSRTIRTPSGPDDDACNACGAESKEGNMIDYAFSHLLLWSGQMGIRAYQMHLRWWSELNEGACEDDEVAPRTVNSSGCSGLELLVDGQVFETYTSTKEGTARTASGEEIKVTQTATSIISQRNANELAECKVDQAFNRLNGLSLAPGVYEIGSGNQAIVGPQVVADSGPVPLISGPVCVSASGLATLCGLSEYTTPSTPPKKYRTETISGSAQGCLFEAADCTGPVRASGTSGSMSWSGSYNYSQADCTTSTSQAYSGSSYAAGADCGTGGTPFSASLAPGPTPDPTSGNPVDMLNTTNPPPPSYGPTLVTLRILKTWTWDTSCLNVGGHGVSNSGSVSLALSDEDMPDDAIARSVQTPGVLCTAKTEARGAGDFTFEYVVVDFTLTASNLVVGRSYLAQIEILEENYGGGGGVISIRNYSFAATGVTHDITDSLLASDGKQLTAQNPTIT